MLREAPDSAGGPEGETMIRSGRIGGAFWRRAAGTRREAVAKGTFHCVCGKDTRVFVFRAQTKRRPTSPDLVAYAAPSIGEERS